VKKLPKVELHCHLGGSYNIDSLNGIIMDQSDISLSNFKAKAKIQSTCSSLDEYLQPFPLLLKHLQTEETLEMAAYDVLLQAADENIIYIEIRFAPILHCEKGLDFNAIIRAVLRGIKKGEKDFNIKAGIILCLMRGQSYDNNLRTVETAHKFNEQGIVGVDLAGSEAQYPPELYASLFHIALEYGLQITIHAGENGPANNVKTAIEMGASRIGHGIALKDNKEMCVLCAEKNVLLELCPTSNLQTKASDSLQTYPFQLFIQEGIPISINTDNRTVSDTTLTKELLLLSKLGLNYASMKHLTIDALKHAFLSDSEKHRLLQGVNKSYAEVLSG